MHRWISLVLAGATLACGQEPPAVANGHEAHMQPAAGSAAISESDDRIAELRRVTAPFNRIEAAKAAGWATPIAECLFDPALGGMGFHYGNTDLIDGTVDASKPELLVYEPEKNGRLQLVAVEYIVPYSVRPETSTPPTLYGLEFQKNARFELWGLHVWLKHNPNGMFAAYNPKVSCEYATP